MIHSLVVRPHTQFIMSANQTDSTKQPELEQFEQPEQPAQIELPPLNRTTFPFHGSLTSRMLHILSPVVPPVSYISKWSELLNQCSNAEPTIITKKTINLGIRKLEIEWGHNIPDRKQCELAFKIFEKDFQAQQNKK